MEEYEERKEDDKTKYAWLIASLIGLIFTIILGIAGFYFLSASYRYILQDTYGPSILTFIFGITCMTDSIVCCGLGVQFYYSFKESLRD